MVNTELLDKHIKDSGLKRGKLCSSLGISYMAFGQKVKGFREFKPSEIMILCDMLGIDTADEKERVFFA